MPPKRTHSTPFALAIDGGVLLNARAQLDPKLVSRLAQALREELAVERVGR